MYGEELAKEHLIDFMCTVFKFIGITFLVLGLIMSVAGLITKAIAPRELENCIQIPATITRIDAGGDYHDVYVEYAYDNQEYKNRLNYWDSTMYEGKTIDINIKPDKPQDIKSSMIGSILPLIIIFCGAVFFIAGLALLLVVKVHNKKEEEEE